MTRTMPRIRAADWYRIRPQADGITHIDEPHIHEFYRKPSAGAIFLI